MASKEMEAIRNVVSELTEKDRRHRDGFDSQIAYFEELKRRNRKTEDDFRASIETVRANAIRQLTSEIARATESAVMHFRMNVDEIESNLDKALVSLREQAKEFSGG